MVCTRWAQQQLCQTLLQALLCQAQEQQTVLIRVLCICLNM
jgi:hypothetical protein